MADPLQPCCERARADYVARLAGRIISYPVIKEIPCPKCRSIIQIRLYSRQDAASEPNSR